MRRETGERRRRAARSRSRTLASRSSSTASTTAQAAAQTTGLPPNVEAWSPGANAPAASSETSSAPIGSPFARPFASVTRCGPHAELLEGEEACPSGPTPVCTSSRQRSAPCAAASSAAAARKSGLGGMHAALALHRLEQDQAGVRPDGAPRASRRRSGGANATPGTSGSNASRFAGWPVTDSAPSVRPWKEPSSATMPGLPVALRAYLSAASIASAPELQKNACAPPNRSESSAGELGHRLRPVEVRDVPEPVELRRARRRAAPGGSGRARRRRSRRRSRGSGDRRRRSARRPRPRRT